MVSMLSHGITNFSGIVAMGHTSGADAMAITVMFPASVGAPDKDATLALTGHLGGTFNSSLEITIRLFRGRPLRNMLNGIPIRLC